MKETDVGRAVVALLRSRGFDVYQEVGAAAGIADIVATRGKLVDVVECKLGFGFDVLAQAERWLPYAHHSYVAVPLARGLHALGRRLAEDLGVGVIAVDDPYRQHGVRAVGGAVGAEVVVDARWNRKADVDCVRRWLREEQKTFTEAGSAGAPRWTAYKATCEELRRYVAAHPGCSVKAAVAGIQHHYRTVRAASSALAHWIDADRVPGVRLERVDGAIVLYPEAVAPRGAPSRLAAAGEPLEP